MRAGSARTLLAWTAVVAAAAGGCAAIALAVGALAFGDGSGKAARSQAGKPFFGYNEDWATDLDKFGLSAAGGADVARAVISWQSVEQRPGRRNWEPYDPLYERMVEAGLRPIWVLADAPCWAWKRKASKCPKRDPIARAPSRRHDDDWADFVADVVERYPQTAAIQTWNEPNLVDFWKPRPDVERAAQMTAAADDAVEEVNPDVPVLFGGLAPLYETIPEKREVAYDEFLRDAYKVVGRGHWDAVAMHPFPRFRNRDGYLNDIVDHIQTVRRALAKSRARGTPIWVTEIGLSTAGPFPYTEAQQAEGLVRIYERLAAMRDVPAIIVHRLIDLPANRRAESGWGVIRENREPKPAYCALARARGRECPPPVPPPPGPDGSTPPPPEPHTGRGS
jgi:hypothetical protein